MPADQPSLLLQAVLRALAPLVRLLVRHGVTYPALAAALKRVFLQAAQDELARSGRPATDSALTVLSGVHRRDVRALLRGERDLSTTDTAPRRHGLAAELVARWLGDARFTDAAGEPRVLPHGAQAGDGFDALVAAVAGQDVRPRALREELLRLGVAEDTPDGLRLRLHGFAPREGLAELLDLMADNLHDHAAAAADNIGGEANHLEQALFVDQLSPASVDQLRGLARRAWGQALKQVLAEATARFEADQALPPAQRGGRFRFGAYVFQSPATAVPPPPASPAPPPLPSPAPSAGPHGSTPPADPTAPPGPAVAAPPAAPPAP